MRYISIILVLVMIAVWVASAGRFIISAARKKGVHRLTGIAGALLMAVGALGFFGTFLICMTDVLPTSFELPVGTASGVVTTDDGLYVVPLTAAGRIQVYDGGWKFIRGWHTEAPGGTFHLFVSDTNRIHVVTARRQMHYTYDVNGRLLGSESYSPKRSTDFPQQGTSQIAPTPIWLWPFTGPFFSWLTAVCGLGLLYMSGLFQPEFRKTDVLGKLFRR